MLLFSASVSWFLFFFFIIERCFHKKGGFVALKKLPCSENGCRSSFAGVPLLFSLTASALPKPFPASIVLRGRDPQAPAPGAPALLPLSLPGRTSVQMPRRCLAVRCPQRWGPRGFSPGRSQGIICRGYIEKNMFCFFFFFSLLCNTVFSPWPGDTQCRDTQQWPRAG